MSEYDEEIASEYDRLKLQYDEMEQRQWENDPRTKDLQAQLVSAKTLVKASGKLREVTVEELEQAKAELLVFVPTKHRSCECCWYHDVDTKNWHDCERCGSECGIFIHKGVQVESDLDSKNMLIQKLVEALDSIQDLDHNESDIAPFMAEQVLSKYSEEINESSQ